MTNCSKDDVIIFLHLPKCGGTTLNRLIEWEYNPLEVFSVDPSFFRWSYWRLAKTPIERLKRIRVFKGHMPFGLHQRLSRPATYITVLREPIDRAISSYYYAQSYKLDPQHRIASKLSLEEYIRTTPKENVQTKLLAGYTNGYDFLSGECTPAMLETAKRNLSESFSLIGLTERFDESLVLAKIMFGWQIRQYANFNVTRSRPKKDAVPAGVRELVAERYRFDVMLYEYAEQLFNQTLDKYADRMPAELDSIRNAKTMSEGQALFYRVASGARKAISRANSALLTI
ncbi:MAG TPA: sulfotransferase family 2 domain-containing protein [Candidatus Binataceae bacterium]|nr:sulfotransferase family 2 domain-containing protein [Candidatus Binataceae bacterium]